VGVAGGHDDHYDPADQAVIEASQRILETDIMASAHGPKPDTQGRVLDELYTHLVNGYRVGRYLLMSDQFQGATPAARSAPLRAPNLVAYVLDQQHQTDTVDIVGSPNVDAAIHQYGFSPTLLRACGGNEELALGWVRLVQDYGFLLAVAEHDLTPETAGPTDLKPSTPTAPQQPGDGKTQVVPAVGTEDLPSPGKGPAQADPRSGGPLGRTTAPGRQILLTIITLGIWAAVWVYRQHEDILAYSGEGVGAPLGVIIYIVAGIVTPFLLANEVQTKLYERSGQKSPVETMTGLWILLPFVGGLVWYLKVQRAINEFWMSQGAPVV
jgi:hypothetical protein